MEVVVSARKLLITLSSIVVLLTIANVAVLILRFEFDHDYVFGLVPLFDFNSEANVPTFYSSVAMVLASVLMAAIAVLARRVGSPFKGWAIMALIFLFLSIDENVRVHELLMQPASEVVNAKGFLYHAWIVPYGIAVLIFVAFYARFLLGLPRRTMYLLIISGALFVAGALGIESIGGRHLELHGADATYYILTTCEEFLEMAGIVILNYTLLSHISNKYPSFKLGISD